MKAAPETSKQDVAAALGNAAMATIHGGDLPHSRSAEAELISGVLVDQTGSAWALALNCGIRPEAFYTASGRAIWETLCELRKDGTAGVDVALLAEALKLRQQMDVVGGYAGLVEMTGGQSTSANVRYYAEAVVCLWERRHAIKMASELREAAVATEDRVGFANKAAHVGQRLIGLGRKTAQRTMQEEIADAREHVLALAEGRLDRSRLIRTGIPGFDEKYGWFGVGGADDKFVMIGGGSGHGKSVVLRQISQTTLEDGKRVLAYTREQSVGDFALLMASAKTGYNLALAESQPYDRTETFMAEVDRIMEEWADKRLFCYSHTDATPLITVEDLCDHARAWCHLHGAPELIIVDFLQMFDTRRRCANNEARVGHIAYTLQGLQRELGCVVAVGVQLNENGLEQMRQVKRDDQDRIIHALPNRSWVRDSQQIYHAADRMIFLYVPPERADGASQTEPGLTKLEVWWHQEKRRKGLTGYTKTWFEKSFVRFMPLGHKQPVGAAAEPKPRPGKVSKSEF